MSKKNSYKEVITQSYTSRNAAYNNAGGSEVTERKSNSGKTIYYEFTKEATISNFSGSNRTSPKASKEYWEDDTDDDDE